MDVSDRSTWADGKTIGNRAKAVRAIKGVSNEELGQAVYWSEYVIKGILAGERELPDDILYGLCDYLEIKPEDLVTRSKSPYDIYVMPDVLAEPKNISQRIAYLMVRHKMSVKELADSIGVQSQTVRSYLVRAKRPGYGELIKLAQLFDISVADLVEIESPLDGLQGGRDGDQDESQ